MIFSYPGSFLQLINQSADMHSDISQYGVYIHMYTRLSLRNTEAETETEAMANFDVVDSYKSQAKMFLSSLN